jgi:hypothetical protein
MGTHLSLAPTTAGMGFGRNTALAKLARKWLLNLRNRLRLVLNRYRKIPGFSEDDVEKATGCPLLWKLPNNYQLMAPAIDKGVPVAAQGNHELSRSFRSLAALLAADDGFDGRGEADGPAVPVLSPRGGGPRRLPPRRVAWEF